MKIPFIPRSDERGGFIFFFSPDDHSMRCGVEPCRAPTDYHYFNVAVCAQLDGDG